MSPTIFLHLQKSTSFGEDSSILQQIVDLVKKSLNPSLACVPDFQDLDTGVLDMHSCYLISLLLVTKCVHHQSDLVNVGLSYCTFLGILRLSRDTDVELDLVFEQMLDDGVLVCLIKRSALDNCKLPAAIKVCVTAGHSEGDLILVTSKLRDVIGKVLS